MITFDFILPITYAIYFTHGVFHNHLLDIGINRLTFGLYLINIMVLFILYKVGGKLDKCLGF